MNQEEYRKLAIARSVERARQEALSKQEEQTRSSSNHERNIRQSTEGRVKTESESPMNQGGKNLSNQNVKAPANQNAKAPANQGGEGQNSQKRNLFDLRRQFENIATGAGEKNASAAAERGQNQLASERKGGQNAPSGGQNQTSNPQRRSTGASRPNALRHERKAEPNIDKNILKRPSALEPVKVERVRGVGVSRSGEEMAHLPKRGENRQNQNKQNRPSQAQQNIARHEESPAGQPSKLQSGQQSKYQPAQTSQPKYKVVPAFTSGKEQKVVEKIATPKPSTIINTSKNQSSMEDMRERQKGSDIMNALPADQRMKVVFLGGVGEIGKNITAIEYMDEILVIDCGLSFPSLDMPGIDLVIPDTTYLKQNASRVKAFLITHGHEDHIGALPYVMRDVKAPIYSGKLTLALIENKLKEHQLEGIHMQVVAPRREYKIGGFNVEFVDVNHSIPDSYAIKVSTKAGTLFHTGDFKIDFQPIDGRMIDLPRIAEIGNEGVDLLLCESTNVEYEGYTLSESTVGEKLDVIFDENKTRRMFVATFSSNIYRVQQILELAEKYKRRVALIGRSMMKNLEAAIKVEKLNFPKSLFVDVEKSNKFEDSQILILCTGSQGESNAALSRLASGEYTKIEIGSNDTVIFSSSPIPGNESNINRVINNLYKKGAIVIHENVHASGHACIEEIKTIHSLIKPKFFVPVHGEYRHLKKHAMLAENIMHMKPNQIIIPDLGDVLEVSKTVAKISGKVQAGEVLVDGYGLGDVSSSVLRERKMLAEEGLVVVVIGIESSTNRLLSKPIVITRGFVYDEEEDVIVEEAKQIIVSEIEKILGDKNMDWEEAKQIIRKPLRNYFLKKTKRSPIILPVVHKVNVNH